MAEPAWPADKVERRRVADLVPYARNARTHSDEQIEQIASSIREWGWTVPVLIDEAGGLIAGHGRVMAAQRLGIEEVPAMIARGWSEAQTRAYVLADNKLALNAGWDTDLLRVELGDLNLGGFDLGLTGFGALDLAEIFAAPKPAGDPDEVPEPTGPTVSSLGDVWILGKHRIVCGDSTDPLIVERCLAGARPHLMVTDPPYGVAYDPDWRNRASRNGSLTHTIGATATGRVMNDDRADWSEAWKLFPGDVVYIWHSGTKANIVADSLVAAGFEIRAQIIWNKDRLIISRGHYHPKHEPCWYAVRKGATAHWSGDRKQSTVWDIAHRASDTGHGTQKPVECMKRPIENNSKPGDAVYEPFSGSGTTIIAGEMADRRVYAIELNPDYVDIAVLRWQNLTGAKAAHEDGRLFDDVLAAKHKQLAEADKVKNGKGKGRESRPPELLAD